MILTLLGNQASCQAAAPKKDSLGIGSAHGWVYAISYDNGLVPLPAATVTARGPTIVAVISQMNGAFQMYLVPGTYNVTVAASGYLTQWVIVSISNGATAETYFYLNPA